MDNRRAKVVHFFNKRKQTWYSSVWSRLTPLPQPIFALPEQASPDERLESEKFPLETVTK